MHVRHNGTFRARARFSVLSSTLETRHLDTYPSRFGYISDTYQCAPALCLETVPAGYHPPRYPPDDYSSKAESKKSAQRGKFGPDIPADIRSKTFGQASKSSVAILAQALCLQALFLHRPWIPPAKIALDCCSRCHPLLEGSLL